MFVVRFRTTIHILTVLLIAIILTAKAEAARINNARISGASGVVAAANLPEMENSLTAQPQTGAANFGTIAIGQTSPPITMTLTFSGSGTLSTPVALTQGAQNHDFAIAAGGSCVIGQPYQAGASCTVLATFKPLYAGLRMGAVVLPDSSGNALASAYISGVGTGPQAGFQALNLPIVSLSKLGITTDKSIAVDGSGNLFVPSVNSTTAKESVVEIPVGCAQASCLKQLPGVFSAVWGLAVDGAGNLWVGDYGANGTITVIPAAGGYSVLKTYSGNFGNQIGLAVDGGGNVYFAGFVSGNSDSITELTAASGYTSALTLATGINIPGGVAVDASGDIFYIDSWAAGIQEIVAANGSIPASPTINTVGKGLKGPQYLAVDASGNLLVTANGGFIYEVMADGGYTTVNTFSNQLNSPTGIVVDGGGNLYIEGLQTGLNSQLLPYSISTVYEIARTDVPSLSFTTPTAPGVTDTADGSQRVSLQNLGNQPLALTGLILSNGNFTLDQATTTCTATSTLAAGDGCTLGVLFAPITTGNPLTGTLTLTDNSLNGTGVQQSLALSGSGLYTPTIEVSSNSWLVASTQDLTLTVILHGGSGNPLPTGTVQVSAANYTGSAVLLINGQASVTVPAGSLLVGQDVLTIQYQPDSAGAAFYVPVQGQASVTVTRTLMNVPSVVVSPAVTSISVGQTVTVVVTVSSQVNGNPMPTGTVTLAGGNYSSPATSSTNGSASFTIPANSLVIGTDFLVANYAPDAASANIYVAGKGTGFVAVSAAAPPAGAAPVDFGSLGIGKTSAATPVTLSFPASATPASLIATTQGATGLDFALVSGGSCGAGVNVAAGQSCTVYVTFTPGFAGLRGGAVVALDADGQMLATTYVHGAGIGAKLDMTSTRSYSVSIENQYPPNFAASSTTEISDGYARPIVTVDGAGNVYVADWGNERVQKIPAGCTQASCSVTVMSGLYAPSAVAVDGAGDLFVTEAGFGDVKKIPLGCQSPSCMQTIGTGFNQPYGLFVDAGGNVFVADTNNNAIKEVVAAGGYTTINSLATGLDFPWSVVVNAAGDLFVAEGGDQCQPWIPGSCAVINTSIVQIPAAGGYKTVNTLGSGIFGKPLGLAIDGAGNVYESDYGNGCSREWTAGSGYATSESWCSSLFFLGSEGLGVESSGDLFFADANSGKVYQTEFNAPPAILFKTAILKGSADYEDGPQSIFLMNNGNVSYALSGMTLSDPSIQIDSTYTTCSTSKPIPAGGSCFIAVDFAPIATGPHSSTLTLTGNDSNGNSTSTIPITAWAMPPAPTILTNPANPSTSNSVAFTFSDAQISVTFICSIDALPFSSCSSPLNYSALSGGAHSFQVKAVDTQSNVSPPAAYNWTVNSVSPPAPTITSAPAAVGNADTATFAFIDAQGGVTFLCSLDGATFAACSTGISYSGLTVSGASGYLLTKWHSFAVEAQDGAGNVSPEATWTWLLSNFGVSGNPAEFGSLTVGQTSAPQAVTFTFGASDTIATIDATTMGIAGLDYAISDPGTCAVGTAVSKGSTCTLKVSFSPKFAGQRKGGVVLLDGAGKGIGEAYLEGTGTAPQVTFTPYSTLWYNMLPPQNNANPALDLVSWISDAAVDGAGNIYVTEGVRSSVDQSVVVNVGGLWEIPAGCTTSPCTTLLAAAELSGQYSPVATVLVPDGVVIDGAGLLWIANNSLGVAEYPTVGSWYSSLCLTMIGGSDFSSFSRIGVDGAGRCSLLSTTGQLYWDSSEVGVPGQAAVSGAPSSDTRDKPNAVSGGGYSGPSFDFSTKTTSMTVDPQGNIFVADAGNNAVKEVLASSNFSIDRTVGSGFSNPSGVTSDAFGNIYVADAGNNALKEIIAASGYTQVVTIATFDPKVITLGNFTIDAAGNIYLVNSAQLQANQLEKLDFADTPALNFPTQTQVGNIDKTDGTLTATVKNNGNAPLVISGITVSNANFQIDASATTCSTSAPLAVSASCTLGVFFSPTASGALTGTLTVTDNALNATGAAQNFALTGTGYTTFTTGTPAVTVAPTSASITTAQADQVTVTVSGATGKPMPTGAVSLSSGNYSSTAVQLSEGTAIFTVPAGVLALGSNTVVAMYTPDAASATIYGSGAGSATVTVTSVPKTTPSVSVAPGMIDVSTDQSLTVNIAVSGGGNNPTPTGSVTLSGGNYSSLATTLINGIAAITIPAGYLPAGTVTLSGYYTPDVAGQANYTSASGTGAVAVQAGSKATPTITVAPASASIQTSQALQVTMTVDGGSGKSRPTGTIVLTAGSYTSPAAILSNGTVIVSIPALTLAAGTAAITAGYTPDTASSLTYNSASGTSSVTVTAAPVATITTLQTTATSITIGSSVSFTATVAPNAVPIATVSGVRAQAANSAVPTGTVTFLDGTSTLGTGTLNASGVATYSTVTLSLGSHSISASYSGDASNAASTSAAIVVTVTVAPAPVAALTPPILNFAAASGATAAAQTATMSNTGNAALTIGGATIGGANASAFAMTNMCGGSLEAGANCAISVTFTPPAAGSFSATLSVADNAAGSPQTITLSGTGSTPPSFTLGSNTAAQTISSGGTASYTLTVTPQNGAFNSPVTFSASGLPSGSIANFSPATLTPGTTAATTQMTVKAAGQAAAATGTPWALATPALTLVGLLAVPRRRRRSLALCLIVIASFGALILSGCGGGFAVPTASQTYTVTVTASGGSVQQNATVQLTVR